MKWEAGQRGMANIPLVNAGQSFEKEPAYGVKEAGEVPDQPLYFFRDISRPFIECKDDEKGVFMAEFCFVIELTEWDHDTDGLRLGSEDHRILRVCRDYEDAKSFVERHAEGSDEPFDCKWLGERRYSGSYEEGGMRYGASYKLFYVPLY